MSKRKRGTAPAPVSSPSYAANVAAQGAWLAKNQLPDGAILYTASEIEPYFANVAAAGMLKAPGALPNVQAWMRWFIGHLNVTDAWGLGSTCYDYSVSASGVETSLDTADSVDSYNATFLTLARQLWDTKDAASQAYVTSVRTTLELLADTVMRLQQSDGLTIAMPSYPVAYLEDNCEVWRGLNDLAYLETTAFGDTTSATVYASAASKVGAGIASLWNAQNGNYDQDRGELPAVAADTSSWKTWYPDSVSQLFPILQGVIPATNARAVALWADFNAAWPQWDALVFPDAFPWALVGNTAAIMGDAARANAYIASITAKYATLGFPYPWYCAEAGWYARMNARLAAPLQAVANN